MNADTALVVGLAIAILSIPAIVSALSDRRTPRVATLAIMIGGGLMVYAINTKEGGYSLSQLPKVVYGVIGNF